LGAAAGAGSADGAAAGAGSSADGPAAVDESSLSESEPRAFRYAAAAAAGAAVCDCVGGTDADDALECAAEFRDFRNAAWPRALLVITLPAGFTMYHEPSFVTLRKHFQRAAAPAPKISSAEYSS